MGTFPRLSNFSLFITYTFEAARNTLIQRGDPSTGWSMGWKVCFGQDVWMGIMHLS